MNMKQRLELIEFRVRALECKALGGRPTTRLQEAKKFLAKMFEKNLKVKVKDIPKDKFNMQLLTKARKNMGILSWQEDGIWYWGQNENKKGL